MYQALDCVFCFLLLVAHLETRSVLIVSLHLQCSLHIHAAYSITTRLNVPMLPLTEQNAVGLILAHGTVPSLTPVACLHNCKAFKAD